MYSTDDFIRISSVLSTGINTADIAVNKLEKSWPLGAQALVRVERKASLRRWHYS